MAGVIANGTVYLENRNGKILGGYPNGDFQESITDLAATTIDSDTIQLSGTAPFTGAYWFQYSADNLIWIDYFIGGTPVNEGAFTVDIDGLSAGTLYYFRAFADGYDLASNIPTATTSGASVPAAPANFVVSYLSNTSLSLAWSDQSSDEDNFRIERSPNGTTGWTLVSTPAANATSDTDTGLTVDTTYYYRLRSENATGNSAWVEANGTTTAPSTFNLLRDFDSGTLGQVTDGNADGFDEAGTDSIYTNEQSFSGGQAVKCQITSGQEGFGSWGGIINLPQRLYAGSEFWAEFYIYLPTAFDIDTSGNGSLKTFRIKSYKADGSNLGFYDLHLRDGTTGDPFRHIREFDTQYWVTFGDRSDFARDNWHRITVYQKVEEASIDGGGDGYTKVWQNGVEVLTDTGLVPIPRAGGYYSDIYMFTYWNGNSPATQHCYLDQIRFSTESQPSWASGLNKAVS